MDPQTGRLFPTLEDAFKAGVEKPVEIIGRPEDVERISMAVKKLHAAKKKAMRKQAKKSKKRNR